MWHPTPEQLGSLGGPGRRFLEAVLAESTNDHLAGTLLLEAAHCLDQLTVWRQLAATDARAARVVLAHTRTLAGLLGQLKALEH